MKVLKPIFIDKEATDGSYYRGSRPPIQGGCCQSSDSRDHRATVPPPQLSLARACARSDDDDSSLLAANPAWQCRLQGPAPPRRFFFHGLGFLQCAHALAFGLVRETPAMRGRCLTVRDARHGSLARASHLDLGWIELLHVRHQGLARTFRAILG